MIIITGIGVHDLARNQFAYGDLYLVGSSYVVKTVMQDGSTAWKSIPFGLSTRMIVMSGTPFDSNGVIVVDKARSTLNDEAKRYVQGHRAVVL